MTQNALETIESGIDRANRGFEQAFIGRATLTMSDGAQVTAKFVVIWRHEQGAWRWHVDIWNMDP